MYHSQPAISQSSQSPSPPSSPNQIDLPQPVSLLSTTSFPVQLPSPLCMPAKPQTILTSSSQQIMISSSPVKNHQDQWIARLNLSLNDKQILESDRWLNDKIISAAQCLLLEQTKGKVLGWQSTLCSQQQGMFKPLPSNHPYVQVLHTDGSHWIAVTNMDTHTGGVSY